MGAERDRRRRVGLQARPAVPIAAQAVSKDVGIASIRFRTRRCISLTEGFHGSGDHDDDLKSGVHQRIDNWTVRAFDRDPLHTVVGETAAELSETWFGVPDHELVADLASGVDDTYRMVISRPIDPTERGMGMFGHG
jgi:hypothetical protein